jgi:putative phosphonate metabolism protein
MKSAAQAEQERDWWMQDHSRYAIYVMAEGALHEQASRWLGWDSRAGKEVAHPHVAGLPAPVEDLTAMPRKYGFHGTVKPPFRLAGGTTRADLEGACAAVIPTLRAVHLDRLVVQTLGGFVAMVPASPSEPLKGLAADCVQKLDAYRAEPSEQELSKRRKAGLSPSQEANLLRWGYPYVMDDFRFHMTLSGKRPAPEAAALAATLGAHFATVMPEPFAINALSLLGEGEDGHFHLIDTYGLGG